MLLRKGIYPYGYVDSWERFDEALLLRKKIFIATKIWKISETLIQKVSRKFNNKSIGDYYDLYVWSDTLLPSHVFENVRNKGTEIYELDPANFLSAPGLAW